MGLIPNTDDAVIVTVGSRFRETMLWPLGRLAADIERQLRMRLTNHAVLGQQLLMASAHPVAGTNPDDAVIAVKVTGLPDRLKAEVTELVTALADEYNAHNMLTGDRRFRLHLDLN